MKVSFADHGILVPDVGELTSLELNRKLYLTSVDAPDVRDSSSLSVPLFIPFEITNLDSLRRADELPTAFKSSATKQSEEPTETVKSFGENWFLDRTESLWNYVSSHLSAAGTYAPFIAAAVEQAVHTVQFALGSLPGSKRASSQQYEQRLSQLSQGSVRAVAWHRLADVIAIAHRQGCVYLYDCKTGEWLPRQRPALMNEFQRDIVCLEWRPLSGTNLAVGCRNGVCLWKVLTPASDRGWSSPTSSGQIPPFRQAGLTGSSTAHVRPSFYQSLAKSTSAIMAFLAHPAMENISCISWSPDGSFLAVGSQDSPVLLVWNVSLETATVLRKAVGHGTTNLSWSPNGRYLLQLCRMKTMRIWETDSFTSIDLETTICFTAACWLYDSRTVLFSVSGNPRINMLQMARKPPSLDYRMHPQAERVPKTPSLTKKGFPVVVGGNVSAMEIDPTGRRLAVTFANGSTPGAELIAMFEIKLSPLPELNLIGFVRGPSWQSRPLGPCPVPEELFGDRQPERSPLYDRNDGSEEDYVVAGPKPLSFKFTSKTTKGTVLAIAWESGHVSFLPCGQ